VRRTSNRIIAGARQLVPVGNHMSGSGVRHSGQQLRASLGIEMRQGVDFIVERIGSKKNYAATVHQGSSAHTIRGKGKMLRFEWARGNALVTARGRRRVGSRRPVRRGAYFYFVKVRHPGNKRPVRYLTTPMHLYGRVAGFRTSSVPVSRSRLP
jgi:hypothetical protein